MFAHRNLLMTLVVLVGTFFVCQRALATFAPYLEQSFFFDYNLANQTVPIPITEQCQTITIQWSQQSATGPTPVAPYYLQIYTSTFPTPLVVLAGNGPSFNWTVPFNPETLYQICMFDSNGNTGGCQAIYTVIPSHSSEGTPECTNLTYPVAPLGIQGTVYNGPMSVYGWVPQCTDISVTPTNGTPPFTLTIASTLHPPWNITSNSTGAINWTVALSWASPFFISVIDSQGNSWAAGPLHSAESIGTNPPTCLSEVAPSSKPGIWKTTVSLVITISSAAGGLTAGLLVGIGITYLCTRRKGTETSESIMLDDCPLKPNQSGRPTSGDPSPYRRPALSSSPSAVESISLSRMALDGNYVIEPFEMPAEYSRARCVSSSTTGPPPSVIHKTSVPQSIGQNPSEPHPSASAVFSEPTNSNHSQIYIVHHDSGNSPVAVLSPRGTAFVDLPPSYRAAQIRRRSTKSAPPMRDRPA